MASLARQIKRLGEAVREAQEDAATVRRELLAREREVGTLTTENEALKQANYVLSQNINAERVTRVSAQRGLVAYMKEHGLEERIGYDPDRDPKIVEAIKQGIIPPANGFSKKQLRELIAGSVG